MPTYALLDAGLTGRALTYLVREGTILRVRQGWYMLPDAAPELQRAVRVGGRLGCVSAAHAHGLAVSSSPELHVVVPHNAARLRSPDDLTRRIGRSEHPGLVVHWSDQRLGPDRKVESVPECLVSMAFCQPVERTIAAADSALNRRLIAWETWLQVIEVLPPALASLLATADGRAESITESIARFRLQRLGFAPRLQVPLPGVGRVDMMLGERLVLEFDGWAYHGDREQFERDRRRDAKVAALGKQGLRFSYRQVMTRWHEVRSAILGALAHA